MSLPDNTAETEVSAVKRVLSVIDSQLIGDTVQREFAHGDPIGYTTDNGAEIGIRGLLS